MGNDDSSVMQGRTVDSKHTLVPSNSIRSPRVSWKQAWHQKPFTSVLFMGVV